MGDIASNAVFKRQYHPMANSMCLSLAHKNILVTGGAGFIGSHLVERIAAENPLKVIVIDNLYLGKKDNLNVAAELLGGRLKCYWESAANEARMREIIAKEEVQVVYNLAVIPLPASLEKPSWTMMENTVLTTVLCELQRLGMFRTLIHFSTSEVYGTAEFVPITEDHPLIRSTPYAASKTAGDMVVMSYAHTFGTDVAILRPFNNYGPRQNDGKFSGIIPTVIQKVCREEPLTINGDGAQTRDYIYVKDTAEAAVRIYEEAATRGKILNIGSGVELTVNDLVGKILEIMGRPDYPVIHGPPRPGDVRRHMAGISTAENLIRFSRKVELEEGLHETISWYMSGNSG